MTQHLMTNTQMTSTETFEKEWTKIHKITEIDNPVAKENGEYKGWITRQAYQLWQASQAIQQQGEPVFAEYLDEDDKWQKIKLKDIGTYEHAMFKTRLLFTYPPATVPLEKYNKLLETVQRYEKHGVTCQTYRHFIKQTCSECNVQAIAEAERKEG